MEVRGLGWASKGIPPCRDAGAEDAPVGSLEETGDKTEKPLCVVPVRTSGW
jgi:hypothetical protein